jgi:hypothetical protein
MLNSAKLPPSVETLRWKPHAIAFTVNWLYGCHIACWTLHYAPSEGCPTFLDLRQVNAADMWGFKCSKKSLFDFVKVSIVSDLNQSEENKLRPKADRARASRAASDQARIETLKLEDAIRFSTVTVDIYQLPQIRQTMVANTDVPIAKATIGCPIWEKHCAAGAERF